LHVSWRTDHQPLLGPHDRAGDGRRVRQQSLAGAARARERHDQDARHAAVYGPAPAPTGKRGRPALKGEPRLRSLAAIANTAFFEAVTITGPDGRERTAHIHAFVCLWYAPFHTRAVKVILIRNPGREEGFDVALASTDTDAATAQLIARYDSRWTIETCHQEAKAHGVGEARNRVQKAVQRTVPFGFIAPTITITRVCA
jgi:hypothetical protein